MPAEVTEEELFAVPELGDDGHEGDHDGPPLDAEDEYPEGVDEEGAR